MISRRQFTLAAGAAMLPFAAGVARAQAWPARPVSVVVPFAAGGTTDLIARIVAEALQEKLRQPFTVENRGGGGGSIGTDAVGRAQPDGYTLLHATASTLTYNPHLIARGGGDPLKTLAPISMTFAADHVVAVRRTFPAQTLQAFIAAAKAKPDEITFGSGGAGSAAHIFGELFQIRTGVKMRHVPYKGSGPALNDLMAGNIDVVFDALPSAFGLIQAGSIRVLAVTGGSRNPALPDVPTVTEAGVADYVLTAWGAMLGPLGMPPDIVATLNAALKDLLARPEVEARFAKIGAQAVSSTPDDLKRRIAEEYALWGGIIRDAGIKTN